MQILVVFKRYVWSMAVAAAITAALILIMHTAIEGDEVAYHTPAELRVVSMLPQLSEQPPPPPPPPFTPPPRVEHPPSVDVVFEPEGGDPYIFDQAKPRPTPAVGPVGALADGDMLPIMTVPPEYPARMLSRGVQGWVLVEFTVDALGRVQQPQVIQAQPGGAFDRAAINAVLRYKYKPRVINGAAVAVPGVRQRIVFNVSG